MGSLRGNASLGFAHPKAGSLRRSCSVEGAEARIRLLFFNSFVYNRYTGYAAFHTLSFARWTHKLPQMRRE